MPVSKGERPGRPLDVLGGTNNFKVARVAARSILAFVVQALPLRNRAVQQLKNDSGNQNASASGPEASVTARISVALPDPAAVLRVDFRASPDSRHWVDAPEKTHAALAAKFPVAARKRGAAYPANFSVLRLGRQGDHGCASFAALR
jgi:hypothetical protein